MSSTLAINDFSDRGNPDGAAGPIVLSEAELAEVTGGGFFDGLVKVAEGVAAGVGVVAAIVMAPATVPGAALLGIGIVGGLAAGMIAGGGVVEMFPEDELPGPGYDVGPYHEIR